MAGRRHDERFSFSEPARGTVRVPTDVIVHRNGDDEWIVISREKAIASETLILDIERGDLRSRFAVHVIESRPIIVGGDMRHRLRLQDVTLPEIPFEQHVRRG